MNKQQLEARIAELEEQLRSAEWRLEDEKKREDRIAGEYNSVLHAIDDIFVLKTCAVEFAKDQGIDIPIWSVHNVNGQELARDSDIGKAYGVAIRHCLAEPLVNNIMAVAELQYVEKYLVERNFGLLGRNKQILTELVEELKQADETFNMDKARRRVSSALVKMRGAMTKMKIDTVAFRSICQNDPWISLCQALIGFEDAGNQ